MNSSHTHPSYKESVPGKTFFFFSTCLIPEVYIELEVAGGDGQGVTLKSTLGEAEQQVNQES